MSYNYLDKTGLASVWAKIKTALETKANTADLADIATSGSYNDLEDIPDILSANDDVVIEDKVPYLYRKSPDSDRAVEEIVGGTVGWNNFADMESLSGSHYAEAWASTITKENGKLKVTSTRDYTEMGFNFVTDHLFVQGHKYLLLADIPKCSFTMTSSSLFITNGWTQVATGIIKTGVSTSIGGVVSANSSGTSGTNQRMAIRVAGTVTTGDYIEVTNAVLTDLTTYFGNSTIADYVYNLESTTAGAGIEWLKKHNPNLFEYNEYCLPTLRSVEGLVSKKTVGFNQWDEEWEVGTISGGQPATYDNCIRSKNFCECLPNTKYYLKCGDYTNRYYAALHWYDADKKYISVIYTNAYETTSPANARYFKMSTNTSTYIYGNTYNHDICINLSDPTRNGQYEPYESHTYSLDSEVVLRGVPKLDSNNNLYFDGDIYPADGRGKRRYTERAYQSGDESLADAITDGTTTVVKLSTPTTFTAQPYHNPQIVGDTEEFVTTGIVPVGHATKYHTHLYVTNSDLAKVATTGNYNDLNNKPTIPSNEIFIGSTTPNGYTLYIDPEGSLSNGEGVSF